MSAVLFVNSAVHLTAPARQAHISHRPVNGTNDTLGDCMIRHSQRGFAAAGTLVWLVLAPAHADAPGVLWQSTSQMIMQGMPFSPPPNTVKICAAAEAREPPPPPPGQTCTMSNVQRSGDKVTWDTQCTGEMDMTGHGEITYEGPDKYDGEMNMTAEDVTITIKLSGKKIGECDHPIG
jgi:hypothetical protein